MDEINKHKSYHFTPLRLCHHKRNGVSEKIRLCGRKKMLRVKRLLGLMTVYSSNQEQY